MSKTLRVFKYDLSPIFKNRTNNDCITLQIPKGAKLLNVGLDPLHLDNPVEVRLWALVDETQPLKQIVIRVAGTGHPIPDNAEYIGSVITSFAWHIFKIN